MLKLIILRRTLPTMPSIEATDSQWWSSTDLLWCCGCCRSHNSGLRYTSAIRRLTSSELLPDMVKAGGPGGTGVVRILPRHWSIGIEYICVAGRAFCMLKWRHQRHGCSERRGPCVLFTRVSSDVYPLRRYTRAAAAVATTTASPKAESTNRRPAATIAAAVAVVPTLTDTAASAWWNRCSAVSHLQLYTLDHSLFEYHITRTSQSGSKMRHISVRHAVRDVSVGHFRPRLNRLD